MPEGPITLAVGHTPRTVPLEWRNEADILMYEVSSVAGQLSEYDLGDWGMTNNGTEQIEASTVVLFESGAAIEFAADTAGAYEGAEGNGVYVTFVDSGAVLEYTVDDEAVEGIEVEINLGGETRTAADVVALFDMDTDFSATVVEAGNIVPAEDVDGSLHFLSGGFDETFATFAHYTLGGDRILIEMDNAADNHGNGYSFVLQLLADPEDPIDVTFDAGVDTYYVSIPSLDTPLADIVAELDAEALLAVTGTARTGTNKKHFIVINSDEDLPIPEMFHVASPHDLLRMVPAETKVLIVYENGKVAKNAF